MLDCIEIPPQEPAEASVIWLHGLGADGNDFVPLVPELRLEGEVAVRFVFPHAPVRPVTVNGGMPMRAWFDIYSLERDLRVDDAGMDAARDEVRALVTREQERGIPAERIVLAGFSQGGSLAAITGLSHPDRLAAIIGLSCWIPQHRAKPVMAQVDTPVFITHGTDDPVVPVAYGRASRDALKASGMTVTWHEYAMAHQVCAAEVGDIREFLLAIFR
jgi:phospholipase/carboxylesterase